MADNDRPRAGSETARSDKCSGRASSYEGTLGSRLYGALFLNPARFRGDRQRATGVKNLHRRLERFVQETKDDGPILDLGSGNRRLAPWVTTLDIAAGPDVDVVGDIKALPFPAGHAGVVIVQQVLEHVDDPAAAASEIRRILRDGGYAYIEVPFMFPVHDPHDYGRWTEDGLRSLLRDFETVESGVSMGPFAALGVLAHRTLTLRARRLVTEAAASIVVSWLLAPLRLLDRLLPASPSDTLAAGSVYVIVRKLPEGR
jgi:SAM-dependent methyltransferase